MILKRFTHRLRLRPNVLKTLYFNFKVFNFRTAIKFPVLLFGNVRLEGLHKGCVILRSPKMGGVRIGGGWHTDIFGYAKLYRSLLRIEGVLKLGTDVTINQGCVISVNKGAVVSIGNNFMANVNIEASL